MRNYLLILILILLCAQQAYALDISLDDPSKFSKSEEMDAKIGRYANSHIMDQHSFDLYYSYAEKQSRFVDLASQRKGLAEQNNAINSFTSFRYHKEQQNPRDSLNFGMNLNIKTAD